MNRKWTMVEPWMNHKWTINEPWMNHKWTVIEPWLNHEWTMNEPWMNHEWTVNEPSMNRCPTFESCSDTTEPEVQAKISKPEPNLAQNAGQWGQVDLGSNNKTNKFLKLMGAGKGKSTSKLGQKFSAFNAKQSADFSDKLEDQFNKARKSHFSKGFSIWVFKFFF